MKTKITFKTVLFFLFAFGLSLTIKAQTNAAAEPELNYKHQASKQGSNYYDIVNTTRAKFLAKKKSSSKGVFSRNDNKAYKHFERWAYFWKDRVGTDGSFPSPLEGWKNAGLLNTQTNTVARESQVAFSAESWTNIGPQTNPVPNGYPNPPQLGRLNAFWRYVDSGNASNNVLLVGAPTGGIWKSTDNGATWSPKFDTFAGIGITDIKGSSNDIDTAGVLYATTGDYDAQEVLNSIGVYKSTDMGETWTATGLSFALSGAQLLGHMVVLDDDTVVVGGANEIKRTTDGGATWTDVFMATFTNQNFGRMASFGTNIVCSDAVEGIYFSTDSGLNWSTLQAPNNSGKHAVTTDETGVFFVQDQTGQIKQLDLTVPSATNVGVIPTAYDAQGGYNMVLLKRSGTFIEGSVNGNTSTDNGANWFLSLNGYWESGTDPGVYMHSDHHQSGYLDAGLSFWNVHDGGLSFITMDGSGTLQNPVIEYKSEGVVNTQIYAIAVDPSSGTTDDFMMANQDNDGFSKENGQWVSAQAGDGVACAINYSDPSIRFLGGTTGSLTRSDQTLGYTGNFGGEQLITPGNAEFVWPLSLDTTTPSTLYGGFDELYVSTDNGDNWTTLSAGAGKPVKFDNQGTNIAVVGTTGLQYSNNSGTSWSAINQPGGEEINSFSIDAATPTTLYATVKGYNAGNKVYKSTDSGASWTNYSAGMPNILMKKVIFKQNQTGEYLFAATELGVYYRSPSVTSWTKLGTNLPNVIVNDMKINYMNDKLYVGTYGRGMWEINVPNTTLGTKETKFIDEPIIFPNPVVNNILNVKLTSKSEKVDYVIYNIVGGAIAKGNLNGLDNKINLNNPAKGIYIIKLKEGNKVSAQKFIVH